MKMEQIVFRNVVI